MRTTEKSPKAAQAADCTELEQLPNVGPAMASDLRALGIRLPRELAQLLVTDDSAIAHTTEVPALARGMSALGRRR